MFRKISRIPRYSVPYIDKALTKGLAWAYAVPNARSQQIAFQPLYQANRVVRRIAKRGNGYLYISRGLSMQTGQPMTVAFVGNWKLNQDNSLLFYEHLLFQEGTIERESLGPVSEKNYRKYGERMAKDVDLVAAVGNSLSIWKPHTGDWMRGPSCLRNERYQGDPKGYGPGDKAP